MRYQIKLGKTGGEVTLYDSADLTAQTTVQEPTLTEEVDKAGSLEFTMPYDHPAINDVQYLKPFLYVYRDGAEIWRGRVTETHLDVNNNRYVYAEGDLAFLNDSVRRPYSWDSKTVRKAFTAMINAHNRQVESVKRFEVGIISKNIADETLDAENSGYPTILEEITSVFVEGEGYHIRTRHEPGHRYIDLLEDGYGVDCNQPVAFGQNLLDLAIEETTDKIYTCLIPLGKSLSGGSSSSSSGGSSGGSSELVNYAIQYAPSSESYGSYKGGGKSITHPSYAWCQWFVSHCAKAVGLESVIYQGDSTTEGMNWFKSRGKFKYKGSYTPSTGDIIYFKTNYSHVGIVMYSEGGYVYTIEGNTSSAVHMRKYALTQEHITGYGVYKSASSGAKTQTAEIATQAAGKTYKARFYCYSPGEGGYYDAQGIRLQTYLDAGRYECAVPHEIPLGSKIQIHVESGNSAFDGRVYEAHDHGDSNIAVWSDGTYGIDLLVASPSQQWSGAGTITIVDGDTVDVSSDTDDTSNGDKSEPVNIKSYKDINTDEFYHKRGKDYIYYKPAVERYGRIFKKISWDRCTSPKRLIQKAMKRLKARCTLAQSLTIDAVDLADLGGDSDSITIGCRITCDSAPHGVGGKFDCTAIKRTLDDPAKNEYTFGTTRRRMTGFTVNTAIDVAAETSDEEDVYTDEF